MNAIVTTDLQKILQSKISEKIRASFIEFLPQETFDTMVESALEEFINGPRSERFFWETIYVDKTLDCPTGNKRIEKPRQYRHGDKQYDPAQDLNTLSGMITAEFKRQAQERMKDFFNSPEMLCIWTGKQYAASTAVKEMVKDNSDLFVQELFSQSMSTIMANIRNNINSIR